MTKKSVTLIHTNGMPQLYQNVLEVTFVGDQIRFRYEMMSRPLGVGALTAEIKEVRSNLPYIIEDAVPPGTEFKMTPFNRES
jgi:hypothetical protein